VVAFFLPSGKPTKNYGKQPFLMGKVTISMAIFNSYVSLPEGTLRESRLITTQLLVGSQVLYF
jgi:hypothetical protein